MAALHKRLKAWQRILLGIFCFPLLPFYLCVYYLCLKDDKKGEDVEENRQSSGHGNEAKNGTQQNNTRSSFINKERPGFKDDKKEEDEKENRHRSSHESGEKNSAQQNKTRLSFINRGFQHHDEENRREPLSTDSSFQHHDEENKQVPLSTDSSFQHHDEENRQKTLSTDSSFQHYNEEDRKKTQSTDSKSEDRSGLQEKKKQNSKPAGKFSYPWDGSSLKSLEIDLNALEKLDHFASKLDTKGTVEQLVEALIRDAKTDLEKSRAFWIWICYHIEYDIKGYKNEALRSSDPNDILRTRKGVCAGYASLFQHMCSIAGLQCKTVSGYTKGFSFKIGQKLSNDTDHAWNMIFLEGSWHLLDSTWGAGYIDDNASKFTYKYKEFYFLTHPAIFIMDHLPQKTDCQLLETCLSREQYENNACPEIEYYHLHMVSYHPQTSVIETVKGKASIAIESCCKMKFSFALNKTERSGLLKLRDNGMNLDVYPKNPGQHMLSIFACREDSDGQLAMIMKYRVDCGFVDTSMVIPKCLNNPVGPNWTSQKAGLFNPSHPEPVIHTDDGCCTISFRTEKILKIIVNLRSDDIQTMPNHVILSVKKGKVEFIVRLPQAGSYALLIFDDVTGHIANYLIVCSNPNVKWPPFPSSLHNPVGPNSMIEEAGLLQPSHRDPIIHTDDGCCTISFRTEKILKIIVNLRSDDIQTMPNHVILSVKKDKVEFIVRLPQAGSYALLIFDDVTGHIGNYLIVCSNPNVKWPPYPSSLHNPVGPNSKIEEAGLLRPSHRDPIIHADDGCCTMSFRTEKMLNITVNLRCDDIQTMPNHVILSMKRDKVEFIVRLPRAGSYALLIFDDVTGCIGSYLIICSNPNVKWPPFPPSLHNPVGPSSKTEKAGLLRPSHPYPIIHADDGCCTISFRTEKMLKMTVNLKSGDKQNIPNHVILSVKRDKVEFIVRLPQAGSFALLIFDDVTGYIGNYLIICSNPKVKWPPFPSSLHNPVGPSLKTEKAGLLQPSHPDPIVHADDGCCTISFRTDKMLNITVNLRSDDIQTMPNHVIKNVKKENIEFIVRLPQAGSYVLLIFDDVTGYIGNYLIVCSNPNVKWPPIPSSLCYPVGPSSKTEKAGLLQPSHCDPIINTDNGCYTIGVGTENRLTVTVNIGSGGIQTVMY